MPFVKPPDSLLTYPSEAGSEVKRSPSFWSLTTVVSTPACSDQSVKTMDSKDVDHGLKPLIAYPSLSVGARILEDMSQWYIENMYAKLTAVEDAWDNWEEELSKSLTHDETAHLAARHVTTTHHRDGTTPDTAARLLAAARRIADTMRAQGLAVEVDAARGHACGWTMRMDGRVVGRGTAERYDDLLTRGFIVRKRESLRGSRYYPGPRK